MKKNIWVIYLLYTYILLIRVLGVEYPKGFCIFVEKRCSTNNSEQLKTALTQLDSQPFWNTLLNSASHEKKINPCNRHGSMLLKSNNKFNQNKNDNESAICSEQMSEGRPDTITRDIATLAQLNMLQTYMAIYELIYIIHYILQYNCKPGSMVV